MLQLITLIIIYLLLTLAALIAYYAGVVYLGETRDLDNVARGEAPGDYVKLDHGWVHYEILGPLDGSLVLLVHGFSVPCYIWDPIIHALTSAGFRVLRFDLYGRGDVKVLTIDKVILGNPERLDALTGNSQ